MMKIAVLTPLPPVKSGIAHYSAMILPELARRHAVTAVVDQSEVAFDGCPSMSFAEFERESQSFDVVICQLGNNVHHEFVLDWARRHPSVVVLHEVVMHHLLVETTLARGDAGALESELRSDYGEAGAAIARARAAGLHGELANFLTPASSSLAEGAKHVIVHNAWASARLRADGVTTPITLVHHPYSEPPAFAPEEVAAVRQSVGFEDAGRVIGSFGFVTHAKRPGAVMEAFARAWKTVPDLRLVFVGESAPNVNLRSMAEEHGIPSDAWASTGYVSDREFDLWLNAVDRVISLRYPTAGETSGPIIRAFAVGRPVAVSDYAQFAELPRELVTRIPFESEIETLVGFMQADLRDGDIGEAQKNWLADTSTVRRTVDEYETTFSQAHERTRARRVQEGLSLHPELTAQIVPGRDPGANVSIRITNVGPTTIRCAEWGQPSYRLGVSCLDAAGALTTSMIRLPSDLRAGDSTTVELRSERHPVRIELRHQLAGIPDVGRKPFAVLEPRA